MAQWNKYEATAARRHGRPGREVRPKSITIDVHSHVAIPRAAAFVKPHLDPLASPLARFANAETKALNQKQEADVGSRAGLQQRLADLDAMGLDMQVIKPPPPQCYYSVPLDIAIEAAQIINDGIAEFVAQKPDRLKGFGTVPMPDGNEAAKELERCVHKLGFKGAQVLTNVNGRELSDPAFAPFWKKAEELGALVVIHPNGFTDAARLSRFYFNNVIGNPIETTIALHYLIFDGVLERHPKLRFWRCTVAATLRATRAASITPGAHGRIRTASCRIRRRLTSRGSTSTRSYSRPTSCRSSCASTAPTAS